MSPPAAHKLPATPPRPAELDPMEIASRDEISALQTARLAWTLDHAYANVPHYRRTFDTSGVHAGAERLGCTVIPVSGGMTERQVALIQDFRPDIITVTPSYMLAILDEFGRQGADPRGCSLAIGIFGAEPWTNAMRAEIEG